MKEIQPKPKSKTTNNTSSGEEIKNKYQWPDRVRKKMEAKNK